MSTVKLLMHDAINPCACEGGWRVRNILWSRRYFSVRELIVLYKSHVLSYIEFRTPAISHASSSALSTLDNVQHRFLRILGVSEEEALVRFSLAPLASRRDIAILGLIHRTALGLGPAMFNNFFRIDSSPPPPRRSLRSSASRRHARHLVNPCGASTPDFLLRSSFGATRLDNILPDYIISRRSVQEF